MHAPGKLSLEEEGGSCMPRYPVWKEKWRQRLTVPASRQPPWSCSSPELCMEKCAAGSGPLHRLLSRPEPGPPASPGSGQLGRHSETLWVLCLRPQAAWEWARVPLLCSPEADGMKHEAGLKGLLSGDREFWEGCWPQSAYIVTVRVLPISSLDLMVAFRYLSFPCLQLPTPARPKQECERYMWLFQDQERFWGFPIQGWHSYL